MKTVWLLRASGGEYDDAWEAVLGVYPSEEDAMAAQIRYEDKLLREYNERMSGCCANCGYSEAWHDKSVYAFANTCGKFTLRSPVKKLPKEADRVGVWYTEEEVGKDDF